VSIIIPVLDKLQFTRQCLDRIWRNTGDSIDYEVIIVDNGSSDGTEEWFKTAEHFGQPIRYHRNPQNLGFAKANNIGATLSQSEFLVFLNNDTLVQPGWLSEMVRVIRSDHSVGIVGIKQLFPYTNIIYHTGVVFASGGIPQHLYPHLDASLPHVNKEREYQAVTGACLMVSRTLFRDCGGFDEAYFNGYEDTDLCIAARQRGRKVVCCTSAFIYHYGQISEGRTAHDQNNAARFATKWGDRVRIDRDHYLVRDRFEGQRHSRSPILGRRTLARDCIYLADDLTHASAWTWVNVELATSLADLGFPVFINGNGISSTVPAATRKRLSAIALRAPVGGVQIKWSHYWARHLNLELTGDVNLEFFVTNYFFGNPSSEPWDYWTQCLRQNHRDKLPASEFCQSVLRQVGISEAECHVLHHGYAPEINDVEPRARLSPRFRFLTVTNSHDLVRYGTLSILEAYTRTFGPEDDVVLVVKDYGASSGNTTIRDWLKLRTHDALIEYIAGFTDKRELIRLYKSCDAFVSAHRGEGFGMKILDAMACGMPVIAPLFGGPTSFCTGETCFPVDFSLAPMKDCLDSQSLALTNLPLWAEPDVQSLGTQMRRVYENRSEALAIAARGRSSVLDRFSWKRIAERLIDISKEVGSRRSRPPRAVVAGSTFETERSPYWLGLRVSVVIPTYNRKEKLLACLESLAHQSVLSQEFEVVVVDDGSTDGTRETLASRSYPFALRYYRQDNQGPGAARNVGIEKAAGELILFIGDDVIADERLLEEHLLAHADRTEPGAAVLGHIDWPADMARNAVMDYICGDAALQFAYTLIPRLSSLDHRFFYASNISLKRDFLITAADAGIQFDPCFRYAAFEDSEFAFRLIPRGLEIRYVETARVIHDHWMDLESFALREYRAGQMAVVFYRKHPGQDEQLEVQWLGDLNASVASLSNQGALLRHLEAFDNQTDNLLRALARSFETLLAMEPDHGDAFTVELSAKRLRAALHNVLRIIFDVERTRGKVREWFAGVDDEGRLRAAQTIATVRRKIELFRLEGIEIALPSVASPLRDPGRGTSHGRQFVRRALRRLVANRFILPGLVTADRFLEAQVQRPGRVTWIQRYRTIRNKLRHVLT
jgi:GT2 family glycosyltransferase